MQSNHGYLATFLVPMAILAGCSKTGGGAAQDSGLDPKASQVLVEVGGEAITLGEFSAALDHMNQFDRLRYQGPERRKELLEEMINVKLLAQEAKRRGYDKDPLVRQEVREILRDSVLERARTGIPEPRDLPPAEVRAYFEAHRDDFRDPERRRLSVIVVKDEATAKEVLAAAKKDPSPAAWGQLVKTRSIDAQAKGNGPIDLAGDFGFVSPPGDARGPNPRVPESVRQAAFARAGTGIVDRVIAGEGDGKSDPKWFVVNVTQKEDPRTRSYEEAERSIRIRLVQEKIEKSERALVDELRKKYPVTIDEQMVKKIAKELEAEQAKGGPPSDTPRGDGGTAKP